MVPKKAICSIYDTPGTRWLNANRYGPQINPFKYVNLHSFHGNPLCDFRERESTYKNTHISVATHPIKLNLVSIQFLDIRLLPYTKICKLSNVHEFL